MKKKVKHYIICVSILLSTFSTFGFRDVSAAPPPAPYEPIPSAGSSGVTVFIDLQWTCGESNLTYDVYLGAIYPPPLVAVNLSKTIYEPDRLLLNTTYFWQIVAYNSLQESSPGPVWSFTTSRNQPPLKPVIFDGPKNAGSHIPLKFFTVAPDPEGDQVYYQWDWGDGNVSEWLGPYGFGEYVDTTYQWERNGSYNITVRARDEEGRLSVWSSVFNITIASQVEFLNCKPGYLYINFFTFDKTFGYIYSLDLLGVALIISTGGMTVDVRGSDSVRTVIFQMKNRILETEQWNITINNFTGNSYKADFALLDGLYETTASAYDENGRLIDIATRQYVIYYEWKFILLKQLFGRQQ